MPKIFSAKKGISPILATLLLVVIAVAAIVVTYAWVMTYMSATTGQAGVLLSHDAVSWPNSTTIVLYVRNTGTSDAVIGAVYIGTSATNLVNQTSVTYNPSNIVTSNGGVISITITYSWTSGTTYYFKVAPKVGAPLEFNIKPS
ncbi:MAG: archaellin/type IV pilin N-terminal domain-containing protein [Candidatus Bathyarchaeia archaeon]